MMDGSAVSDARAIHDLAVAYCEGLHHGRADLFADMCHEDYGMSGVTGSGGMVHWDKAAFVERVRGRGAFEGDPSYEVLSVDMAGDEMGRAHLWVDVPPRRYEDHLGFIKVDGTWKLITKVFRTMDGPALEG